MSTPEPGWYADPSPAAPPHSLRWWDGGQWTGHVRPGGVEPATRPRTGPTTPEGQPLAGWWWRVLSHIVDVVAVGIVSYLVTLPWQLDVQRALLANQEQLQGQIESGRPVTLDDFYAPMFDVWGDRPLVLVLPAVLALAYHAGFLRWRGATLGKLMSGLRVRPRAEDARLSWGRILRRVLVQFGPGWLALPVIVALGTASAFLLVELAALLFLALDALLALGRRRQTIHDRVAGTVVVTTR